MHYILCIHRSVMDGMVLSEDDVCYLLNIIGEMIDGKEEQDLMLLWNLLTHWLSEYDKQKQARILAMIRGENL